MERLFTTFSKFIVSKLFVCLMVSHANTALGDDLDTQLRLNREIESHQAKQEQTLLKNEDYVSGKRPELILDGKRYPIRHNANDLGRALYIALQQKQWDAVIYFLEQYQTLPQADPLLIAYTLGALARQRGHMAEAQAAYQEVLRLNPSFLPGQLELARVLFEDHQNQPSQRLFEDISRQLDQDNPQQAGVIQTVELFLAALNQRVGWSGTIGIGSIWTDNLNQSAQSRSCLLVYMNQCVYERKVPDAISAQGLDYELSLSKNTPLTGHNSLYFRALNYGKRYDDYADYNENTFLAEFGYQYQNLTQQFQLAPLVELSHYGDASMYQALGIHALWATQPSSTTLFRLQGRYKELEYLKAHYQHYDGPSLSLTGTLWKTLPDQWTLFAGLDALDKKAADKPYGYFQTGVSLGVIKTMAEHFQTTLIASVRDKKFDAYSAILGETREDQITTYQLIVKAPNASFLGFSPSLLLKHSRTESNVDWLYSHKNTQISLKIESQF